MCTHIQNMTQNSQCYCTQILVLGFISEKNMWILGIQKYERLNKVLMRTEIQNMIDIFEYILHRDSSSGFILENIWIL